MNWILGAALSGVLVELALQLPFTVVLARVKGSAGRTIRVLRFKSVSDHWKQKAMGAYARTTFAASVNLAGLLLLLAAAATVCILAFEQIAPTFWDFILSWQGVVVTAVMASLYFAVRKSVAYVRL